MAFFLKLARGIDALNEWVARWVAWLVLIVTLLSAGNAIVRKIFNVSSNGLLEIQWYLFSAIFLLYAGYTLLCNAHVRIDVLTSRLGPRTTAWIDIFGTLFFLFPAAVAITWFSWGVFVEAWRSGEVSANQGGLTFWPARLLVPVGFALLLLQGFSELIKRIGYLRGHLAAPITRHEGPSEEEALAEDIRRARSLDVQGGEGQ
ncbi:MAG: TRAP-type mannitol/chloroaromatic compound transport system, small permease component [Rhodocyclales bacterium]|nr:TRAP-type mannitol/chloroaromatic compound transport system, small permease component [Rhodocyclales bacterium]MDB5887832.1 TRAP-type mannitol/chloroaromatic compound transport system, small permease component [Rhodocyclales bacterium]